MCNLEKLFKEEEQFVLCERDEQLSPYGNSFVIITEKHIKQLRQGKILIHDDGEYCTLIKLGGQPYENSSK